MFEMEGIVKIFSNSRGGYKKNVLKKVNFYLKEGERVGLIGPSGCGKTTLARIAMKLLRPTYGKIMMDGVDVTHMGDKEFLPYRRNMQMVFQNPYSSMDPTKTMRWSLTQAYSSFGIEKPDFIELCKKYEIPSDVLDRRPAMVSGGEIQRFSIMRCMASNPKYVVLDESTSMLDASIQASIIRMFINLNKNENKGMMMITHDLELAEYFCDRVYIMIEGEIVEEGKVKDVFYNPSTDSGRDFIESYMWK